VADVSRLLPALMTALATALLILGCGAGDFVRVDEDLPGGGPEVDPECPADADCTGYECGEEPVCGATCGACDDGAECVDSHDEEDPLAVTECCLPQTCSDLGATCGVREDGCGGTITCGVCLGGSSCDEQGGGWACGCVDLGEGAEWAFDVPTATLTVRLTIDGAVPPASASTATEHGAIVLKPAGGQHGVRWDPMYRGTWDHDVGAARETIDMTVLPGPYDIYYRRVGFDWTSAWPMNELTLIAIDVDVPEGAGTTIEIDLSPITLPVELLLDGAPLSEVPIVEGQGIRLELRTAADEGDQWEGHENPYPDSVLVYSRGGVEGWPPDLAPEQITMLPGSFGLFYSNTLPLVNGNTPVGGTAWPLGWNVRTMNLALGPTTDALVADLPFTEVTFDVTLEGAPVTIGDFASEDVPAFGVRRTEGNSNEGPGNGGPPVQRPPWLDLPPLADAAGGVVALPMTVRLFEHLYEIAYRNDRLPEDADAALTEWPLNTGIVAEFTAADGITVGLDIESVEIEVQATLNGEPLTPENTSAANHGRLRLKSATTFSPPWTLPPFVDDEGTVDPTRTLQVLPDRYEVGYTSEDRAQMADWPVDLTGGRVLVDVDLTSSTALSVDVPVVELDLVADYPDSAEGQPIFRLANDAAPTTDGWDSHGWVPAATAQGTWMDYEPLRILPGSYRAAFLPDVQEPLWPHTSILLNEQLTLFGDAVVAMDLDFRRIDLRWTLDGDPDTASLSSEQDHGTLFLTGIHPRATFNGANSVGGGQSVNLPPGSYLMHYYPAEALYPSPVGLAPYASVWPLSPAVDAGCMVVQ